MDAKAISRVENHLRVTFANPSLAVKARKQNDSAEVYIADEAFFTGTAAEVTPIRELDRRVIGKGERGPITEKIQNAFFDIVNGRNRKYHHWLTPVAESKNVAAVRA